MLPRIPEPELMDTVADAVDYDAMDHSIVNRRFAEDFLTLWDGVGPILDLGTGTARIPIEVCRLDPRAEIVAVDAAEEMLKVARHNVAEAGLSARIRLVNANARRLPDADATYPAIMSNSIIHHLHEPESAFAEIVRVWKPTGTLLVRDLCRPINRATLRALVERYAGNESAHAQQLFAESLHAALTLEEVRAIVARHGFSPDTVSLTSDRHWTWMLSPRHS